MMLVTAVPAYSGLEIFWFVVIAMGDGDLSPLFSPVEIPPVELQDVVVEALSSVPGVGAFDNGMVSLREDGARKVLQGMSTLEEVLRVTKDERAYANGAFYAEPNGASSAQAKEAE